MLFATVREKADGKGHYARIITRGLCAHNDEGIMRAKSQGDYAGIMIGRSWSSYESYNSDSSQD